MLFDSVEIENYVITVLHLQLGVVNGVFDNFVEQSQNACEQYTDKYVQADQEVHRLKTLYSQKSDECIAYKSESKKEADDLESFLMTDATSYSAEVVDTARGWRLEAIPKTRFQLRQDKEMLQKQLQEAEQVFLVESQKEENSKKHSQPVRAHIESIAKTFGIDRAAYHGGDIQGLGC